MMKTRYAWRPGAHISIDAQKAGEELEDIRRFHNGRLTAEEVLERAKDDKNPLHDHFTWDDTVAAVNWRKGEAGQLIRSITIDISTSNLETMPVRAFVSVEREGDRSYTSTAHAMSDKELRQQVLARAMRELLAWKERYREFEILAKIFAAIEDAAATISPEA